MSLQKLSIWSMDWKTMDCYILGEYSWASNFASSSKMPAITSIVTASSTIQLRSANPGGVNKLCFAWATTKEVVLYYTFKLVNYQNLLQSLNVSLPCLQTELFPFTSMWAIKLECRQDPEIHHFRNHCKVLFTAAMRSWIPVSNWSS